MGLRLNGYEKMFHFFILKIKRAYLLRFSCQPLRPDSPKKEISGALRRFSPN